MLRAGAASVQALSSNMRQHLSFLTHSYREICKRVIGKHADPEQMSHDMTSDQGLHCSQTGFSIKIELKRRNKHDTPKMTNGRVYQYTIG